MLFGLDWCFLLAHNLLKLKSTKVPAPRFQVPLILSGGRQALGSLKRIPVNIFFTLIYCVDVDLSCEVDISPAYLCGFTCLNLESSTGVYRHLS